ncbi:glycyl aminopeptidase [Haladaptatus pallidirubidus]|uniref:glycyl aminopeptidase n=1 Tax=Haladaptatus pallidirubidus TaxID=1008152 RepID=UPI001D0FF965|nr:glycyl aminopeptidase [Haladaptatus pallidirubidus]
MFDEPDSENTFWLINYTGNVVSSTGFISDKMHKNEQALRWDGETKSPSVTITSSANEGNGQEYTATNRWILGPTPQLSVAWAPSRNSRWQYRQPFQEDYPNATVKFADSGVLGSTFTYIGAYEEHTHHADGQQFQLIVANDAAPADPPSEIFKSLTMASKHMPGKSPDKVLAFVLPDPSWRGGYASPSRDELWVHEDARLSGPRNLWIHEYVHTRQSFELGKEMMWFREASAAYFASNLSVEQGRTSQSDVLQLLTAKKFDESALSKPNTWASHEVPYYQGAYTLWALDARIRNATNGERSLFDVFDRMNSHEGTIDYGDFKRIVTNIAGQSIDPWLNQYVTTSALPELQEDVGSIAGDVESNKVDDSNSRKTSGGNGNFSIPDANRLPVMIDDSSLTLFMWGGLGLVGLVFALVVAQYISGQIKRIRKF